MTTSSEKPTGDFATDLAALRQDVARLSETVSDVVQHQARAAGHRVSEAAKAATGKLVSTATDAQNRTGTAGGAVEASIERNPLKAVLIALGVGMSLGLLSGWRGSRTCSSASQPTEEP